MEGKWIAGYPYLHPRESLKGSRDAAMKSLLSTERMLAKNVDWGETYSKQIHEMSDRGVARHVPPDELIACLILHFTG